MLTYTQVERRRLRKADDLVKLVAELGYDTCPQQLQCDNGAHVSALLHFFDDNPDALEAMQEWILDSGHVKDDKEEYDEEEVDDED